jgi:hypothetical protein
MVELAAVTDPDLVAEALVRSAGIELGAESHFTTLARRIHDRQVLMLMDNCEHVVGAVARLVARLLPECAGVAVLATSRERLNIEGETLWRVPSMGLPAAQQSTEAVPGTDAVRLFWDRARSVRPDFDVDRSSASAVAAICRRVDGMPLAIELAAARVNVLSPAEILSRLEDRFGLLTSGTSAGRSHGADGVDPVAAGHQGVHQEALVGLVPTTTWLGSSAAPVTASCSRPRRAISALTRNRLSTFPDPACNSTSWCCSDQSMPTKITAHLLLESFAQAEESPERPNSSARRRASTYGAQRHDILSSPLLSSPRGGGTVLPQGWLRRATR